MTPPLESDFDIHLREARGLLDYNPATGVFIWKADRRKVRVGDIAGCLTHNNYIKIKIGGRAYMAHRLAWLFSVGQWPITWIDHIDGNRSNNRLVNLRLASRSQNQANRNASKNNQAGLKGVFWDTRKSAWIAQIYKNGRKQILGRFDDSRKASVAYDAAAIQLFGEFARPNGTG